MRTDIDLNFTAHPLTGDLATKTSSNAIDQAVKNLIMTNFYERGFNIEVGSNLTDSLFNNFTVLEQQTIKSNITRVLKNFEPNIEVSEVICTSDEDYELTVTIYYTYANNSDIQTIVIPIERFK